MTAALYIGKEGLEEDGRIRELAASLEKGGCSCYFVFQGGALREGTDLVLSVGGDGTFLSVAMLVADSGIPVVGVNLGRLGFLSENHPEDVAQAVLTGDYTVEDRSLLAASLSDGCGNPEIDSWPYALNEVAVHRSGAAMLGVDVCLDGKWLPRYWADGLIVSTSSGSTAYSLSVGGPIVLPQSKVLILAPIAPHNLNVRPLVVPDTSEIVITSQSRDGHFEFSADTRTCDMPETTRINIKMAQFSLKRVRLNKSCFIQALTDKLYWGEDVRNIR